MAINSINTVTAAAAASTQTTTKTAEKAAETTKQADSSTTASGVIYEKSSDSKTEKTSNKTTKADNAAIVAKLKADAEQRTAQLRSIVEQMMTKQGVAIGTADDMWKFLAKGNFTVDAATKAQAQQDISEDGYYGVKQTSERLFDFASALAGDDVEKMKKMQAAMQKGFKEATGAWGKDLPDICQKTLDAANKKFENYYKSKESVSDTTETEA